jgi:L-rhamnose isomerase/sugar isomerase
MADVPGYAALAESLNAQGLDVAAIKAALKAQKIETPSWGYANSGTRFKILPGQARHVPPAKNWTMPRWCIA